MNDEQREKANTILQHYGATNQRHQLIEECAELIQALNKYERVLNSSVKMWRADTIRAENNIASEIADVLIMIEQVSISLFNDDKSFIDTMIDYKLNRQLKRIEEEKTT